MTTVADIVAMLDRRAPFSKAAGWDPAGLQIGDPQASAQRVAICHEVTADVVDAAVEAEADLLIAYHPLLFRPTRSFVAGPTPSGRALALARAGIALVVVHTAFDVAAEGTAHALAAAIGITEPAGFGPAWGADSVKFVVFVPGAAVDDVAAAMARAGAGRIGNYTSCSFRSEGSGTFFGGAGSAPTVGEAGRIEQADEMRLEMVAPASRRDRITAALVAAHPYEEPAFDVFERTGDAGMIGRHGSLDTPTTLGVLTDRVAGVLRTTPRVAGDSARSIERVAVVPGSGADFVAEASAVADVLITGDVSHHRAREALDRGLAVIDAGHVPTERPGLAALYAAVAESAPETIDLTGIDPHPWKESGQWTS